MPDLEYLIPTRRIKKYAVVTINNTSSYATANPHVQLIEITHYDLEYILGIELSPYEVPFYIYFYDPNQNTLAYSWYDYFDGTYHYWWVKTPQISAGSTYNIYMIYDSTAVQLDGNYVGINPYYAYYVKGLLPTYGQYDNGTNVFYYYWNWAGTSLPSGWTASVSGGGSYSVNNGLTLTVPSGGGGSVSYSSFTIPSIGIWSREWFEINQCCGCSGGNDWTRVFNTSTSGDSYMISLFAYGGSYDAIFKFVSGSEDLINRASTSCGAGKAGFSDVVWIYTNNGYWYVYEQPDNVLVTATDSTYSPSQIVSLLIGIASPASGTASYTAYPVYFADAPLSYNVVNGVPVIIPYTTFAPAD